MSAPTPRAGANPAALRRAADSLDYAAREERSADVAAVLTDEARTLRALAARLAALPNLDALDRLVRALERVPAAKLGELAAWCRGGALAIERDLDHLPGGLCETATANARDARAASDLLTLLSTLTPAAPAGETTDDAAHA